MFLPYFVAGLLFIVIISSQTLPPFIKPCTKDWKINRCAIENGNFAIPFLAADLVPDVCGTGAAVLLRIDDKNEPLNSGAMTSRPSKLQVKRPKKCGGSLIPPVDPLQLVMLRVVENGPAVVQANMTFKELYAYGLKEAKVNKSDVDLNAKHMVWRLNIPLILFGFKYKINGHISSRPIRGTGNGVIELDEVELIYLLDFNVANIAGVDYLEIVHSEVRHTTQLLRIQLDNLFNGNQRLGNEMNILLNEHWVELNKQLGPPIDKAFHFSLKPIVDYILTLVPYNQVFPK